MPFHIEYSPETEDHLSDLTARQRAIVLDAVDRQLVHEPDVETRNRKPLRPNSIAPWELRIDNLRVYYEFQHDPEPIVTIRAVGKKIRDRVMIGGEEVPL